MRRLILVTIALIAATGCSQKGMSSRIQMHTEVAPSVDMSSYKTWNAGRSDNVLTGIPVLDDATFRTKALNQLEKDMAARGLVRVFDNTADLKLMMHVTKEGGIDEIALANQEFDFATVPEGTAYEHGSLTMFLFDAKSGQMVWQGNAAGELDEIATDNTKQERFLKVMGQLVEQIPMGGSPVPAPAK